MSEVTMHTANSQPVSINLSEAAKRHLINYLTKEKKTGVRFGVKKTGCSGLSYTIDYVETIKSQDLSIPLNEVYQIYIDKGSYPFLQGMTVDYVKEGFNSKFIFTNPNQTGQCGCGESFTVNN